MTKPVAQQYPLQVPTLRTLGLTDAELSALAQQGFISTEYRGNCGKRYGPYFKLRWRQCGRQRVKYLGSDPACCARVRNELERLQRPRQEARELQEFAACARRLIRRAKAKLAPHVEQHGFHFVGLRLRKRTQPVTASQFHADSES